MNTGILLLTLGFGLAAVVPSHGAEPAPKLVPRPLPGFGASLKALSGFGSTKAKQSAEAQDLLAAALEERAPTIPPEPLAETRPQEPVEPPMEAPAAAAATSKTTDTPNQEVNSRARVIFIHRRATLPAKFTTDLVKPVSPSAGQQAGSSLANQTRPGKIRIIPKAEVASLLASPAEPKPAAP